jgi:hypothetical protein
MGGTAALNWLHSLHAPDRPPEPLTWPSMLHSCALVRESTTRVANRQGCKVTIDDAAINRVVSRMSNDVVASLLGPRQFDVENVHFNDPEDPELTARYILCVDAINFCFWPDHEAIRDATAQRDKWAKYPVTAQYLVKNDGFDNDGDFKVPVRTETEEGPNALLFQGLEYEHIALGLKKALEADPGALDAKRLTGIDGPALRKMLGWPRPLPLEDERARLLREVGQGLLNHFGGSCARLINAANGRAHILVDLVVRIFGGFRDVTVDPRDGSQVFLYKRAQIFVGDLWGRFNGRGLGHFDDTVKELTMFADYRVPVVLRSMGILIYEPNLARKVDQHNFSTADIVQAGSAEEVDIRACTVQAVERMRAALEARIEHEPELNPTVPGEADDKFVTSVALDWFLWKEGERQRDDTSAGKHHRTLTVFY